MIKVAVTKPEYEKARQVFASCGEFACIPSPSGEKDLAAIIRDSGARHAIIGVDKYSGELYDALPRGGVIARFGVGHDGVDKRKAAARGIHCTNTPGALDDSVAECAVALLLSAARGVCANAASVSAGGWSPKIGLELRNRTLAIIGCGAIGCKVAAIAVNGFGMRVVGCDIKAGGCEWLSEFHTDFGKAVRNADFVSLHIPDLPATKNFLDAEKLSLMAATSILINTSRGSVVDENALFDSLVTGCISGAALDVFRQEPYSPLDEARDLRKLDNVIMTPHIGSSTREACERMARSALLSLSLAEQGRFDEMPLLALP